MLATGYVGVGHKAYCNANGNPAQAAQAPRAGVGKGAKARSNAPCSFACTSVVGRRLVRAAYVRLSGVRMALETAGRTEAERPECPGATSERSSPDDIATDLFYFSATQPPPPRMTLGHDWCWRTAEVGWGIRRKAWLATVYS